MSTRISVVALISVATSILTTTAHRVDSSSDSRYPTICVVRDLPNGQTTEICVPYPL